MGQVEEVRTKNYILDMKSCSRVPLDWIASRINADLRTAVDLVQCLVTSLLWKWKVARQTGNSWWNIMHVLGSHDSELEG
jgi:hypothetical protein